MAEKLFKGPFDIPDIPNFVPRRLKPWLFIIIVVIVQFSGGLYLAATENMVGATALMSEDIRMAGYAQLIGMSLNFAVMFRIKFRYTIRTALLACACVMLCGTILCAQTDSVLVLVATSFVVGWFRMQATFACNSTIQLWLTPVRDMSIFFTYVYLVVDGSVQLSGILTVFAAEHWQWEYMHWIMGVMLMVMILLVLIFIRPVRFPMFIPLLGIDWIGSILWGVAMMSFTFICVYGDFYDWWQSSEIIGATLLCITTVGLNLWRASFLRHPYLSFQVLTNRNVVRALALYAIFSVLMATEHVFEHTYAAAILGYDEENLISLNWYAFAGILVGVAFTYLTFARRRWRYKTMTAIAFALGAAYLAYFYFTLDYNVDKELLFLPLFLRGTAVVILSIILLTSIMQSGLPFMVFPQALLLNGFGGAVMFSTLGPAIVGEWLQHAMARNASLASTMMTNVNPEAVHTPLNALYGMIQQQAMVVSMKEIYGWLLIAALVCLTVIILSYGPVRPSAFMPKWGRIRRLIRHTVRLLPTTD